MKDEQTFTGTSCAEAQQPLDFSGAWGRAALQTLEPRLRGEELKAKTPVAGEGSRGLAANKLKDVLLQQMDVRTTHSVIRPADRAAVDQDSTLRAGRNLKTIIL